MSGFSLGFGMGLDTSSALSVVKPPDVVIARLAHRLYGVGYNGGAAPLTGDGTPKTYNATFVNTSGAPMGVASVATQGWTTRETGLADTGNDVVIDGTIEYPVGTIVGTFAAWNTPNGGNAESQSVTLATPVPVGGSFKINLSSTVPNAAKYLERLGFAGVRNHALRSKLTKLALFAVGDSIMTNNNGAVYNAAGTKCPAYHVSISGTRASNYSATFAKQASLAARLGITHVISDFGTNDFGAGATYTATLALLYAMRDACHAVGVNFVQTTMTPRTTQAAAVALSAVTVAGTSFQATVSDASMFLPGNVYTIAGANEAEFNGSKICTASNSGTSKVTFLFAGSAGAPTGSLTAKPWKATSDAKWMTPISAAYAAGANSPRGLFNAEVRKSTNFDGFIEWADACEPFRDAGIWRVAGDDEYLPTTQIITVSSVISTSRFNSNYNRGSSTMAGGFVQPITGANAGQGRTGNGNTNGDITVSAAFSSAQAVGDQYYAVSGVSWMSDDHLHTRVPAGGKGGQVHLDNVTATWIDTQQA